MRAVACLGFAVVIGLSGSASAQARDATSRARSAASAEEVRDSWPRRSGALIAVGVPMIVVGAGTLLVGVLIVSYRPSSDTYPPQEGERTARDVVGVSLIANGAGMIAGGIVLTAVGNRRVPPATAPRVGIGPGTASVRWAF